jgi:hypothetical protein
VGDGLTEVFAEVTPKIELRVLLTLAEYEAVLTVRK